MKGFEATGWFGLYMPAANGNAAYTKLIGAVREVLQSTEIKDKFATQGVEPSALFGDEFAKFVSAETEKWGRVVKTANVPLE